MSEIKWCDERFPEVATEIKTLWYWIARYHENPDLNDLDVGDRIDRVLAEIIMKVKGDL